MDSIEFSIAASTHGLPEFLAYLAVSVVLMLVYMVVYSSITPHNEFSLIRQNNMAAAVAFTGSLLGFVAEHTNDQSPATKDQQLGPEYLQLLDTMGYDPVSIDTLVARSGLTIEQLSSMLLILELNDRIKPASGGLYVRC